jgi:hypothetical protein
VIQSHRMTDTLAQEEVARRGFLLQATGLDKTNLKAGAAQFIGDGYACRSGANHAEVEGGIGSIAKLLQVVNHRCSRID